MSYFELEAHNTSIRRSERANLQQLYDELVDPKFQLYLYFLQGRLPILADINIQLQTNGQDLYTSYQKIAGFKKTFFEPILHEVEGCLHESNIRKNVDNIDYDCTQVDDFKNKVISSGQLSYAQLHEVMKNIFNFTVAISRSLDSRFPELDSGVQNVRFFNPANRKVSKCDIEAVVRKYCRNSLNGPVAKRQFSIYRNDESMDYLFLQCEKQPDTFFSRLTQIVEYGQFGLLG